MAQVIVFLLLGVNVHPQTVPPGFKVEAYGDSLADGTTMAWAPDGRLFVGQLGGAIRVLKNGNLLAAPFHSVAVDHPADTDRGLLGLCVDPDFANNGYVYVYFTIAAPASHNCVRRLKANPPSADVSDGSETAILDLENLGSDTMHNGGEIQFGGDGKLYVGVGDNAVAAFAQSLTSRFGKILRINADGSLPGDNPGSFAGIVGSPMGEFRSIWAVGLRNPFRFAFQPGGMRVFINDVGADTWEEIDDGAPGSNYGWVGGDSDGVRGLPNFSDPIYQYGHSGAAPTGKSITGGVFYNPSVVQFPPEYLGKYFFSDFFAGFINTLDPASPATSTPFLSGASGPVDLEVGPDGALYYLSRMGNPGVYRVSSIAVASAVGTSAVSQTGTGKKKDGGCGATGVELVFLVGLHRRFKRRRGERP